MRLLALRTVLAAIDVDGSSRPALTSARDLAAAAGAELHLLYVARADDSPGPVEREAEQAGIARERAGMHVIVGDPAHEINMMADKLQADVIVLGPHRERPTGERPRGLTSTALAVVTNASVPCLVITRELQLPLDHVVVGVDFSDSAAGTLVVALTWASALRSRQPQPTLTAIHVAPPSESANENASAALERTLTPIRRQAGKWSGLAMRGEVVAAETPSTGVATYVETHDADLVALGTRGLGLDDVGRLGSVAADVIRRIDTPVLLVPPAMWSVSAESV